MQAAGESLWNGTKIPDQAFKYLSYMEGKEGQKIWSKAGTDLPGRKSVMADFAAGKLFDDPTLMPPNGKVWADITPKCEIFPIITKDATDAYTKAYNDVLAGKINAKDAFTEANKVAMISLKSK
jgi:ABC-type glycerol-3-phosphate transport system substrate-binding protein